MIGTYASFACYIVGDSSVFKSFQGGRLMNIVDLENELGELEYRLNNLLVFLNEQKEKQTVSDDYLELLYRQYVYMGGYMKILIQRITDLDLGREL